MYQYASKKTTVYAKKASSDTGKKSASSRRRFFNSSVDQHNWQVSNTIQRSHIGAEIPPGARNQYSAGSARRSTNEFLMDFSEASPNNRQVSENIISSPPIVTAIAPRSENQYGAGAARLPLAELLSRIPDNQEFIKRTLLTEDWRELIECEKIRFRAEKILKDWNKFLPEFLKYHGFESYRANQSHTYHRSRSNDAAESIDHYDELGMSKIMRLYKDSSGIRESREYTDDEAIKRYLRHCAAALAINFGIEDEIQCYYDNKVVYVAANNNAGSGISGINGTNVSECSAILQHSWRELIKSPADNDNHSIWGGFHDKLVNMVTSNNMTHPLLDKLEHGIPCPPSLIDAAFQVIGNTYGIQGLHAERQLLYYLRDQKRERDMFLDPLRLGGIRRPCFICSVLCFADMSQVHPGPVWVSEAASEPNDVNEMFLILEAIRNKNNTTHVTSDKSGHLSNDLDTESEGSESEGSTH